MKDSERRNRPLFPISIVMELAELSARQIRYYEEQALITPARTKGGHRVFSFSDIDRLLEIKSLLDKGVNLAGIKEIFERKEKEERMKNSSKQDNKEVSNSEIRKKLKKEIVNQRPGQQSFITQGDLSRFFH